MEETSFFLNLLRPFMAASIFTSVNTVCHVESGGVTLSQIKLR